MTQSTVWLLLLLLLRRIVIHLARGGSIRTDRVRHDTDKTSRPRLYQSYHYSDSNVSPPDYSQ